MTTKGSEIMRTSGGVSWTWLRAVVATVLVGSALVLNPGGAASDTETTDDATTELDAELAFAQQILDVAQNPDVEPSQRAIDTARMALDHRRGQVDAELLPLLDQQARNLDTAEDLLALGEPDEENALEYGIAAAKVATNHQAATLGLDLESVEIETPDHGSPSEAALALVGHAGGEVTGSQLAELQTLDALPDPAQVALTNFIDAFIGFSIATDLAYADADMARIEALLDVMDDPEAVLDLVDSVKPRELLADLGIDFTPVFAARNALLDTVEPLRDALLDPEVQQQSAAAPIQVAPYMSIELGTATNNTYSQDFMLSIDVGGDDTYLNNAGGGTGGVAALVDLLGSDQYRSGDDGGINGGGWIGTGFLLDAIGDEIYTAGGTGTNGGGALGGAGFLLDGFGEDDFAAGAGGTNGGGAGGTGMLINPFGADQLSAAGSGSNGGGSVAGVGFLMGGALLDTFFPDRYVAGNEGTNGGGFFGGVGYLFDGGLGGGDTYSAKSKGTNGGGGGLELNIPLWPSTGGAGFLFDLDGDDAYEAISKGTNGGGETGIGILLDAAGTDTYTGGSDGVNGGAEFGMGLLTDIEGNDAYSGGNPGVNGAASFGTGLLIDTGGSDVFSGSGATSNGGSGFGTGTLINGGGHDRYTGGNGGSFAGTGLLFDIGGTDRYRPNSSSTFMINETVVPKGLVGAQVDSDSASPVPTTIPNVTTTSVPLPTTTSVPLPTTTSIPLPPTTTTSIPLPTTTSIPLPTTTTSSSTTTTSTTTSSTTTSSTTTTTTPPPGGGSNVGAGGFTGSVAFEPPGLPPILAPCAPTTFSFDGEAEAFVLNTTIVGYAGPVTFEGGGSSDCENATGGSGSLTLSAEGEGPTGSTIVCDSLTGDFSRFLVRAQINLTGDCTINGISTTGILFTADVLVAADGATGITDPVMLARFAGDFAVSPG